MEITLDTHSLIWFVDKGLNKKLSRKALKTIRNVEEVGIIYIPIIVLMEILHLIEKGKINLTFSKLLDNIENSLNYQIIPFDTELLRTAETITGLEAHDRLILATAMLTNSILISKDNQVRTKGIKVIW